MHNHTDRKQQLTELLNSKKKDLLAEIRKAFGERLEEDTRLAFETARDNPDKSVDEMLKHVNAAIIGNKTEELDAIESAMRKLNEGSYGVCEECEEEIPFKRLEAVPFALYCVDCQHEIDGQKKRTERTGPEKPLPPTPDDYLSEEE